MTRISIIVGSTRPGRKSRAVADWVHDIGARRLGCQVSLDLGATAFVHAHPGGDQAPLGELVAAGVTLTRSRP